MKITRIKAPKFTLGRYSLNEYEVRKLMLEVCKGEKPEMIGATIYDSKGKGVIVQSDGCLSDHLDGLELSSELAMDMYRIQRKRHLNNITAKNSTNDTDKK